MLPRFLRLRRLFLGNRADNWGSAITVVVYPRAIWIIVPLCLLKLKQLLFGLGSLFNVDGVFMYFCLKPFWLKQKVQSGFCMSLQNCFLFYTHRDWLGAFFICLPADLCLRFSDRFGGRWVGKVTREVSLLFAAGYSTVAGRYLASLSVIPL